MSAADFSVPSPTKRRGRPKGTLGDTAIAIRTGMPELMETFDRMTVRQAFYALEVRGVVDKTEAGYKKVQRELMRMRRDGLLPWGFITDGTRWQRKPETFNDVDDFMARMARTYRRDLWQAQGVRIEIWLEKDALAGLISDITMPWDVSLMVSRGQSSATFLYSAAQAAAAAWINAGQETVIYGLYDRDAGGHRAMRTIERDLPEHAPDVPITFERLAVLDEQITEWDLPSRPAKEKDPEAAKHDGIAVELDAIPPDKLIGLVENAIKSHIDADAWQVQQVAEREERDGLERLLGATS
jgi:hypothetical protein